MPQRQAQRLWQSLELPTWGVILATYLGILLLTNYWTTLPFWVIFPLGALLLALHNSIQHEAIHKHPTHSTFWNSVIAGVPLNLWRPYGIYKDTHIQHHKDEIITYTLEDPESYYVSPEKWEKMGILHKKFRVFFNTFLGRISIGPAYAMVHFLGSEMINIIKGEQKYLHHWLLQFMALFPVLGWLLYCEVPLWQYFLLAVYPAEALSMVRSFAEHKAAPAVYERIAIVESNRFFSFLFLNNNLHCAHHWQPSLPWYELPQFFQENRQILLKMNGNYYFKGYAEIVKKYWNTPWIHPLPPLAS